MHTEVKPQRIESTLSKPLPKLAYIAMAGQFRALRLNPSHDSDKNWYTLLGDRILESTWKVCLTFSLSETIWLFCSRERAAVIQEIPMLNPLSFNPQPKSNDKGPLTGPRSIPLKAPERCRRREITLRSSISNSFHIALCPYTPTGDSPSILQSMAFLPIPT